MVKSWKTSSTTYLGVELASDLTWKNHINRTCSKANKQLAFLRRNLQIKNKRIKETAFKGLVRPATEYCATIWDPHHQKYIDQVEAVQRRAARFVNNDYSYESSPTEMIRKLEWESLKLRRRKARLNVFYKIQQNLVAIPLPPFIIRPYRLQLKLEKSHHYRTVFASTEAYKNSFFVRTVFQWNLLPSAIATLDTFVSFKNAILSYSP